MEIRAILIVSSILFSCGCIGLVTVRLTNPFFKGLGWLGAAFASGALGATAFAVRPDISLGISVLVPDTLILAAYVFLHASILELTEGELLVPWLGICLLAFQAVLYPILSSFRNVEQLCVVTLGLLLAIQAAQTAMLLKGFATGGMRAPMGFSILLLANFAIYNVFRSAVVLVLGTPQIPQMQNPLELTSAFVFLGTGLGLGFGVFWMTSTQIRIALEGQANTDPLTGIYNRRSFVSLCERELLRSSRMGEEFSLIMFDVDHFKPVNDRHGHETGDAVLCAVVDKLRNSVRNIDIVGRWGGEEFVALLPRADSGVALLVAQRLRRSIESLRVIAPQRGELEGETEIRVTVSVGFTTYSGQVRTVGDLLHECDTAMYQAKAEGRNRIVFTGPQQYALSQ